jgi:hypothetical protein
MRDAGFSGSARRKAPEPPSPSAVIPGLSRDPLPLRDQESALLVQFISAPSRLWIPGQARDDGGAMDRDARRRPAARFILVQLWPNSEAVGGKRGSAGPPSGGSEYCRSPGAPRAAVSRTTQTTPGFSGFQGPARKERKPQGENSEPGLWSRSETFRRRKTPPAWPAPRLSAGRSHHRRIEVVPLAETGLEPPSCVSRPGAETSGHPHRRRRLLPAWPAGPDTPSHRGEAGGVDHRRGGMSRIIFLHTGC